MNTSRTHRWWFWLAVLVLILLAACDTAAETAPTSEPTETRPPTATLIADSSSVSAPITATETVTAEEEIALTLWTVEPVSPIAPDEAGPFIERVVRRYENTSGIDVDVLLKKPSGKGGILDFLRTSSTVAPEIMPDVVVMNVTDLTSAYQQRLIQPLDGKLDREIVQDVLPAARRIGSVEEELVGMPLGIQMEHPVYNTTIFTDTPQLWSELLASQRSYLFPAKGEAGLVNDASLALYFSLGGRVRNGQGQPVVDEVPLLNLLTFYQNGLEQGVIDPTVLDAATTEDLWSVYLEGQAGATHVTVQRYLDDRDILQNTAYMPLPTRSQEDVPVLIMRGWAIALVTTDTNRQEAALALIEEFLSTNTNARWNEINRTIPTLDSSFQQVAGEDEYWAYLDTQLSTARRLPAFEGYDRVSRIIQQAIVQVIGGDATPEEATATAIDNLVGPQ